MAAVIVAGPFEHRQKIGLVRCVSCDEAYICRSLRYTEDAEDFIRTHRCPERVMSPAVYIERRAVELLSPPSRRAVIEAAVSNRITNALFIVAGLLFVVAVLVKG